MSFPDKINPIIKLTEVCNYSCDFCRYSNHRQIDEGMPEDLIIKIVSECISYNLIHGYNKINVIFHGGEPLLYGADRLQSVIKNIDTCDKSNIFIDYSIQTNASLISEKWIQIFKRFNFDVGISLDGPSELNNHHGIDNKDTVMEIVKIYHMLRGLNIRCGFLSVITDEHLSKVNEFFDFFIDNNIDSLGLCFCFNSNDGKKVNPEKLGDWLIELYELYYNTNSKIVIREFDNATRRIIKYIQNSCDLKCRNNCGCYLTFSPNGNVDFCDDYIDNKEHQPIGNIKNQSLVEIVESDGYKKTRKNVMDIVEKKCLKCDVRYLCKGGCARNDIGGDNFFCGTYKKLYSHIEKKVLAYYSSKRKTVRK